MSDNINHSSNSTNILHDVKAFSFVQLIILFALYAIQTLSMILSCNANLIDLRATVFSKKADSRFLKIVEPVPHTFPFFNLPKRVQSRPILDSLHRSDPK